MELIVIRHARPERIQPTKGVTAGAADPALTEIGLRQADLMAEWMTGESIDAMYVSPMARALQTSRPLEERLGIEAVVETRIREYDAASAHYIPIEEVKQDRDAWRRWVARQDSVDRTDFSAMVNAGFDDIIARHRGQRVVAVCHGGVINVLAARILGIESRMFFNPHYTSINRMMAASSGERSILSLNDIGHLRAHPELVLH